MGTLSPRRAWFLQDCLRVLVFYGVLRGVPESKNWFFIVKSMVWKKIKVRNSA